MTDSVQFTLTRDGNGFYLTVADDVTVYERYEDAVAEIQAKLNSESDSFLAEVVIDDDQPDDVAVTVEQVSWQQIIRDLPQDAIGSSGNAEGDTE